LTAWVCHEERVNADLVIEAPLRFRDSDGQWHDVKPGDAKSVGPVALLFNRKVRSATFDGRTLALDFDDHQKISVETTPTLESWSLAGEGVPEIIAGPWVFGDSSDE
jgi:hypothetical protein